MVKFIVGSSAAASYRLRRRSYPNPLPVRFQVLDGSARDTGNVLVVTHGHPQDGWGSVGRHAVEVALASHDGLVFVASCFPGCVRDREPLASHPRVRLLGSWRVVSWMAVSPRDDDTATITIYREGETV